jgi:hypothetical protein
MKREWKTFSRLRSQQRVNRKQHALIALLQSVQCVSRDKALINMYGAAGFSSVGKIMEYFNGANISGQRIISSPESYEELCEAWVCR